MKTAQPSESFTNHILVSYIGHGQMATHKQTIKAIQDFLRFSEKYRKQKVAKTATIKEEVKWIELYKKLLKIINEYDINKINYSKGKNV